MCTGLVLGLALTIVGIFWITEGVLLGFGRPESAASLYKEMPSAVKEEPTQANFDKTPNTCPVPKTLLSQLVSRLSNMRAISFLLLVPLLLAVFGLWNAETVTAAGHKYYDNGYYHDKDYYDGQYKDYKNGYGYEKYKDYKDGDDYHNDKYFNGKKH
ncbi:hypothetical protein HK102_008545 [Quaeritorhiza haematococci]|nr:hypothetical protein HK102_008545 [Quaeritorhiza haematococci]